MSTAPTPKQSAYLASLVATVAAKESITERQVHESLGLIEANPWGGRVREEVITKASVSRYIDQLKARASSVSYPVPV